MSIRMDGLRALDAEIRRLRNCARLERITSWVNGTGHAKATEYTRQAEEAEALHTLGCRPHSASVDERIQSFLRKAGCFVIGVGISVAAVC